jgi:hypothetical protein
MNDRQTALDWLWTHLQGIGAAIVASWDAAVGRAAPALRTARDWVAVHLQGTADWARAAIRAVSEALRPYLASAFAAVAPHWPEIVMAATGVAVIGGIAVWALRSLRRYWQLKASLVEATLGHDPKTDWLELGIVMRNLQPCALLVRSIEIIDPPGTKICDRWQAWQPTTVGVKFVAPDLELTNSISIERTVLPYGSVNYAASGGSFPQRPTQVNARARHDEHDASSGDELARRFYVLPPGAAPLQQIALRVRLICELQTRRVRRQGLAFRRTLPVVAPRPSPLRGSEVAVTSPHS